MVARLVTRLDGMPLAIELAAARVEALGLGQLLDRLDDRFTVLTAGDRLAASRHRSLAAAVEWSCRLLEEDEQRVFRAVSVFPGPFTLEAAEAVAGPAAQTAMLHLVDCSLLVPPQAGPDGRSRYGMLETLRAYGAELLAEAGEQQSATAALAAWAVQVAEQAAAGMQSIDGETAAARRLDAEDAAMRQVLAWSMDHDLPTALRMVAALGWWWHLRGRLPGQHALLRQAARRAETGSDGWCAAQFWLARTEQIAGDPAAALSHSTALRDAAAVRGPCRALADGLHRRSMILANTGRFAEMADESRRALAVAREIGYPAGEAQALMSLGYAALCTGDHDSAVQLAWQAAQITAGVPAVIARWCGYSLTDVLIGAGDLAAAGPVCAAALARAREAGDLWNQASLLGLMVTVDLAAGRHQDAAAHLRESLRFTRTGNWFLLTDNLDRCGHLCAATGRLAEALTVWAALGALMRREGRSPYPPEARSREEPLRQARRALGPGRARAAEDRGTAMSTDIAAEYALMLTDPDPPPPGGTGAGDAERPGTGTGHPGRSGPHRRADRRRAVHQHPHRPVPPGPHPGQDRLPPPRRPDPPGPQHRAGLTGRPGQAPVLAVGSTTPGGAAGRKGVPRPLPRHRLPARTCLSGPRSPARSGQAGGHHVHPHLATASPPEQHGAAGCRAAASARRGPGRRHLHPAGVGGRHAGRLGGQRDPARRAHPGAPGRRGDRGRHARLADHPDRGRRRPGRGHRGRPAGPGAGRPPDSLRDTHHVRRPPRQQSRAWTWP